jgi:peptidoglycan/xylan/chitin deacetylase (PgdA/CDA1 family)
VQRKIAATRVAGALVALGAAWLFPQRSDPGSRLISVLIFAGGIGLLLARTDRAHRALRRISTAALVVAVVVFGAYVGAETPTAHWFGGGITHGPTRANEVALTFDDGPNVTSTLGIMKILDAAGVKGTFFEVGKAIDAQPQITRALYEHGQLLGNHSYEHDQWRWLDPRYPELERTQKAFRRAIGVCPAFFRPPHGDRTPFIAHVVNDHHMRIIMWNVSAGDWAEKSAATIARRIVQSAKPGAIILLHDGLDGLPTTDRTVLVRAMPLILDGLRKKHLDPVGLNALIGGPAYVSC